MDIKDKMMLLRKGIEAAKELQDKATNAADLVFEAIYSLGINPDKIPTNAENSDNLEEAISCYISYGEYSVDSLMKEIYNACKINEDEDNATV